MIDLDKIRAASTARRRNREYILSACDTEEACAYVENGSSEDTIDALVAEVERLRQLIHPASEIVECTCGHTTEVHTPYEWTCAKGCFCYVTLARSLLKDEETPVHPAKSDKQN